MGVRAVLWWFVPLPRRSQLAQEWFPCSSATYSLLVLRPCYLGLRRAVASPLRPSGVVLVEEDGRAIRRRDVEDALGVPVKAVVAHDRRVARAVDAGLLAARLPSSFERS